MTQQAVNEVTDGHGTKSAKIRALAEAGYERAEIAKALGIRYQHVRNVLIRSGNTGSLRRQIEVEREPVTVEAAPVLEKSRRLKGSAERWFPAPRWMDARWRACNQT